MRNGAARGFGPAAGVGAVAMTSDQDTTRSTRNYTLPADSWQQECGLSRAALVWFRLVK